GCAADAHRPAGRRHRRDRPGRRALHRLRGGGPRRAGVLGQNAADPPFVPRHRRYFWRGAGGAHIAGQRAAGRRAGGGRLCGRVHPPNARGRRRAPERLAGSRAAQIDDAVSPPGAAAKQEVKTMQTINIVLVEPQIPQNSGNIARTCAVTGARLHMVGPMGFAIDDKKLKRAGLDYWHQLDITYYKDLAEFFDRNNGPFFYFTSKGRRRHVDVAYPDGAYLVFGREDAGLPEEML